MGRSRLGALVVDCRKRGSAVAVAQV